MMSSAPTVRRNTFLHDENVYIDPISKIFVIVETAFGLFRLPMIRKWKLFFNFVAIFHVVFLNVALIYITVLINSVEFVDTLSVIATMQYNFCCLFGLICCKKLQNFYDTLNKFDKEVRCRPKVTRHGVQNLVQAVCTFILNVTLFVLLETFGVKDYRPKHIVILHIACSFEVSYYGHLLSLLTPRLRLMNYFIESSLANAKLDSSNFLKGYQSTNRSDGKLEISNCHMRKLMDLYHVMVEAYEYLIDAIKWQLLVIIISAFLSILGLCYFFSLNVIKGGADLLQGILTNVCSSVLTMIPLFAPCIFGDKVHREVKRLRELLASKLYENKLDKSGRSIARALLAFTETRDLSFRLLRMLNIDISLPFKFMGLLATYLIILLQFEKVINP